MKRKSKPSKMPIPPAPSPHESFGADHEPGYYDIRSAVLGGPPNPGRALPPPPAPPMPQAPAPPMPEEEEQFEHDDDEPEPAPQPPELRAPLPPNRPLPSISAKPKRLSAKAPVFIKIDKYRDIVDQIQSLKSYSVSLRDALDALADIEKELQTGLSITHKALDKFNETIHNVDKRLLGLSGKEEETVEEIKEEAVHQGEQGATEMDKYVKGLYEQMERIRSELKTIS